MLAAFLTAAYAGVLAVTASVGRVPLAAALLFVQAVLAAGWLRFCGVPPSRAGTAIVFLAGGGATAGAVVSGSGSRFSPVVAALGLAVVLAFLEQLAPGGQRTTLSLTATVTGAALAAPAAGYVAVWGIRPGSGGRAPDAIVLASVLAGVGAAVLVAGLPTPLWLGATVGTLGSVVGGAALWNAAGFERPTTGALLGFGGGVAGLAGHALGRGSPDPATRLAVAFAVPLTLGGPAAYLLGRLLVD